MRKTESVVAQDWHAEQVKAEVRMRGTTLNQLAVAHSYEPSSIYKALVRPWPALERIIAQFLDKQPQHIWPSRYDAAGNPVRAQRSKARHLSAQRHRQKAKAA